VHDEIERLYRPFLRPSAANPQISWHGSAATEFDLRHRGHGVLLKYDINSLLHGVFIAKSEIAGGRMRVPRVITAFIEAKDVTVSEAIGASFDESGEGRGDFCKRGQRKTARRLDDRNVTDFEVTRGARTEGSVGLSPRNPAAPASCGTTSRSARRKAWRSNRSLSIWRSFGNNTSAGRHPLD
jgi:hypothetical protein